MSKFIAIICFLFSFSVFGDVGETYVCEEKKINRFGFKAKKIIYWKESSFEIKDRVEKGTIDTSAEVPFYIHKPNYFISIREYRDGYLLHSFDGKTYIVHYVENGYSVVSEYSCEKFWNWTSEEEIIMPELMKRIAILFLKFFLGLVVIMAMFALLSHMFIYSTLVYDLVMLRIDEIFWY